MRQIIRKAVVFFQISFFLPIHSTIPKPVTPVIYRDPIVIVQKTDYKLVKPLTPYLEAAVDLTPLQLQPLPVAAPITQSSTDNSSHTANYNGTGDPYLDWIVAHESGGNPFAINPSSGSCGLFQALPCSKLGCALSDITCQIAWGISYCNSVYGSTYNAMLFWQAHNWY